MCRGRVEGVVWDWALFSPKSGRSRNFCPEVTHVLLSCIERRSPSLSGGAPWDLISEKLCIEVNGEREKSLH